MKKKLLLLLGLIVVGGLTLTGCKQVRQSALDFKEEYESVNGTEARNKKPFRSLSISKYNPIVKITQEELISKLDNNETFYLYVGDSLCPWCRSGIEKFIEVAMDQNIENVYYVDFWDEEYNDILRNLIKAEKVNGEIVFTETQEATTAYKKLMAKVEGLVQDYTVTLDGETYNTGEKRVMGGDLFYFKDGEALKYASLRSDELVDSFGKLTEEVLADQEKVFTEFFNN